MSVVKMRSKGEQTREKILDLAEEAVLAKGFAGTSIDELIAAAGITKSGFFYHFADKNALAKALLQRYLDRDKAIQDDLEAKAHELTEDPLEAYLIYLKLLADTLADIPNGHPGCLAASYVYQDHLFSQEVRDMNVTGVWAWRRRCASHLKKIAARYPPKAPVDLEALADLLLSVTDGAIILSKAMHDPSLLPRQILIYRSMVRLTFQGA